MPTPEDKARENIDRLLTQAGWAVRDQSDANILAYRGVAIRNFTLKPGHGFADYLLYVDGRAAGVIEAKKEGVTLTGVETQSERYTKGLPDGLPAWNSPLPFSYESTGIETRFTNGLDPEPRSRPVFSFHKPETLAEWLEIGPQLQAADRATDYGKRTGTFLSRMQHMPPLIDDLWPPKPQAIMKLEQSLRENRPRSLVQMATGSGKTLLAIVFSYRLLKFAGARRVLFLVDRGNLGEADAQGVPAVRLALQQLQIHRRVHRPAPDLQHARHHGAGLHQHHPAPLFHAQGRGAGRRGRRRIRRRSGEGLQRSRSPSTTTRPSPSRPSTSSSPTNATAPSTTSGARCWNTSTPTSSALPPRPTSRPSASSIRTW